MPKKLIQRFMPEHHVIKEHKHLQFLGEHLHNPNLWHLNRKSAALAFAVGFFYMYLPIPGQMIVAAVLALLVGANLPLSVVLVWITNPVTMPPMFYAAYKLGSWVLGVKNAISPDVFTLGGALSELGDILWPLLLGSLILGVTLAVIGYFGILWLWRFMTIRRWRKRRRERQARGAS
ncbi:conserved hypothetical protein [Methylomarinovum caldicuralii]|uniref:DUF2062 domain-containing protein n=1 Tax=Methylomarinovum caldicuralii TaxID=438856 RepID=A0AAU9C3C4_9GAMM|nr:DUF2062 domain-containing protein [Methylomarinovum caldicuralii]BCX82168.1 conserved hypothetical protein [Methylomarinovum caldicuralii]